MLKHGPEIPATPAAGPKWRTSLTCTEIGPAPSAVHSLPTAPTATPLVQMLRRPTDCNRCSIWSRAWTAVVGSLIPGDRALPAMSTRMRKMNRGSCGQRRCSGPDRDTAPKGGRVEAGGPWAGDAKEWFPTATKSPTCGTVRPGVRLPRQWTRPVGPERHDDAKSRAGSTSILVGDGDTFSRGNAC